MYPLASIADVINLVKEKSLGNRRFLYLTVAPVRDAASPIGDASLRAMRGVSVKVRMMVKKDMICDES